jgi:signal transduction histidine kinase
VHSRLFSLSDFIAEIKVSAALEAQVKECGLNVSMVDPQLAVDADRDLLSSAVGNLLQNAFKFTHHNTAVTLNAYAAADRIFIDVEDNCGGLPPGDTEKMFLPFAQSDEDRTGLGLGLSIARRSIEANKGTLSVRDVPTEGCVFTIDLPRRSIRELSSKAPPDLAAARNSRTH